MSSSSLALNPSLVLHNAVTVDADSRVVLNGALAVSGNKIAAIGQSDDILNNYSHLAGEVVDLQGKIRLPAHGWGLIFGGLSKVKGLCDKAKEILMEESNVQANYLMQWPETKKVGDALGFGSAFLFSAMFSLRLASTRKLIPSGLLLLLSVGSLVVFYSAYIQDKIPQDIGPM